MLPYKKCIKTLHPYVPGKPIDEVKRELGLDDIIKMASNENALGPSPKAIAAMQASQADMHLYPEGGCFYLKKKLAEKLGVNESNIVFGSGSNEIIEFVVKGFLSEGKEVLSSEYAFAVYPILTQVYGGKYVSVPMQEGYIFDLDAIYNAITENTQIIFIANPNNPTGTMLDHQALGDFVRKVPRNILICLDEAYFEFADQGINRGGIDFIGQENVLVLRTFSKVYGLAGLRIGYGVGCDEIIDYCNRIRQPFNVNQMAQVAALAALDDTEHLRRTVEMTNEGREFLYKALEENGIEYIPSVTNFLLVKVADSDTTFQALLRKSVIVRSMKPYKLNEYIRVTIGTQEQNEEFVKMLIEIRK